MRKILVAQNLNFALQSSLIAGLAMLISMVSGELLVSPDLFDGVHAKPISYFMILAESAVWMFPLSLIASFALQKFKHLPPTRFLLATLLIWAVIGTTIICVYKIFWFPPCVPAVTRDFAQLAYGWIIPCALIWLALTILSLRFRVEAKSETGR